MSTEQTIIYTLTDEAPLLATCALLPIVRAFTKRFERGPAPPNVPPPDVVARLQRIEQAVESVAIEVERIAEAQRFSAKLLAEKSETPSLPR